MSDCPSNDTLSVVLHIAILLLLTTTTVVPLWLRLRNGKNGHDG